MKDVLWVDFNSIHPGEITKALRWEYAQPCKAGDIIPIGDFEGNRAQAEVIEVKDERLHVRMIKGSFVAAPAQVSDVE